MSNPARFVVSETETFTIYEGSREDLIAEGVATASMFPEGRKRVKDRLGPDIPKRENWITRRLKGNRYRLIRYHEYREPPREPIPWSPGRFKSRVAHSADMYLDLVQNEARGGIEGELYGRRTHRICREDLDRIRSLSHQLVDAILQARVIAAGQDQRQELRVVK